VRHFGFEPDKDVQIIVTGESPTRLAARSVVVNS